MEVSLEPQRSLCRGTTTSAASTQHQFTAQQNHYVQYYPTANHDMIVPMARQVGGLYVAPVGAQD